MQVSLRRRHLGGSRGRPRIGPVIPNSSRVNCKHPYSETGADARERSADTRETMMRASNRNGNRDGKVRVAVVGVGNCASALVQGTRFYRDIDDDTVVPGLIRPSIGGYRVKDVEFSAAFDINATKVGRDLSEAVFADPNNTFRFCDVPHLGVPVHRGMTHDGIGRYLRDVIVKAPGNTDDVAGILRETRTDVVVNYLPVGSEMATKWYVEQALAAGCAFVNCIPVFIASQPYWDRRFQSARLPLIGDDVKSQLGATITHRVLARLFEERGIQIGRAHV